MNKKIKLMKTMIIMIRLLAKKARKILIKNLSRKMNKIIVFIIKLKIFKKWKANKRQIQI